MACDPSKKCPICDQQGLVFLPVRYNVARTDGVPSKAAAPALKAPFVASGIALPEQHAKYALRLLRAGYLYVFNEKRNEWKGYVVSDDAHLVEYAMDAAPPKLDGAKPCARMAAQQTGRYLVFPDAHRPDTLGKIWLAYSPVAWTKTTLKKHKAEKHRKRHMRSIDAKAWAASGAAQAHLDVLYGAMDKVSEFHLASAYQTVPRKVDHIPTLSTVAVYPGNQPFAHSLTDWAPWNRAQVDSLGASARRAAGQMTPDDKRPPPGLVALDDPIGMSADLNQLIIQQALDWTTDPERQERFESAQSVLVFRDAIKNGAITTEESWRKDKALMGRSFIGGVFGRTSVGKLSRPVQEWDDAWFAVENEQEVRRLGQAAWAKYEKHLKGKDAYETYLNKTYPDELKEFTKDVLRPLDNAYIAWLDCAALKQHMICSFDPKDAKNGMQYQEAAAAILNDALGRTAVFEHVHKLLEEDPTKPESIFTRAFVWNLDDAVAQWKAASEKAADPADWVAMSGTLYSGLKEALEKGAAGELTGPMSGIAKYMYQLAGPLTRMMGNVVDSVAEKAAMRMPHKWQLALMGAVAKAENPKMQLVDLRGYTHPNQATRSLANQLAIKAGIPGEGMRSAVRTAMGSAVNVDPATGAKLFKFGAVVLLDEKQMESMKSLNLQSKAMRSVRVDTVARALRVEEFDRLLYHSVGKLNGLEFKTGVVGIILAAASLPKLHADYVGAEGDAKAAKSVAMAAGITALVGNAFELAGVVSKNLPWGSQKLAQPMGRLMFNATTRSGVVIAGGRWLGAFGGFIAGALMIKEGVEDYGLNKVFGFSMGFLGGVSMALAVAVLFGFAIPFAILAFLLVAVATVVVGLFKPDDMERWLDKVVHWGKNSSGKFSSIAEQSSAIKEMQKAAHKAIKMELKAA